MNHGLATVYALLEPPPGPPRRPMAATTTPLPVRHAVRHTVQQVHLPALARSQRDRAHVRRYVLRRSGPVCRASGGLVRDPAPQLPLVLAPLTAPLVPVLPLALRVLALVPCAPLHELDADCRAPCDASSI